MNNSIVTSFSEYSAGSNLSEDNKSSSMIDPQVISNLVDLVGSEKDVEKAAKEAFQELKKSFEKDEIELKDGDGPVTLTMAALVIKLVEMGKLGPQEADKYIEENLGDGIDKKDEEESKE